jgi:sodium/potassium-transporting ATPase subunit alpha
LYLGVILLFVVLVTAIFSFTQESKAASVMKGFQNLVPQNCKVCRGGNVRVIPATELVVGDIVHIRAGDKIPADLRIIFCQDLKVNNSALTGESEAQPRSAECTDKNPLETHNLAFYTSLATEGDAVGVVIRTGDHTVLGKIASLANEAKKKDSPLTMVPTNR